MLSHPAARATRVVALRLLGELGAARARLDAPDDAEALHDLRVALRRLRSLFRAYDAELGDAVGEKTRRRLRRLARATGEARDLEVHLAWLDAQRARMRATERPGVEWLIARLRARQDDALAAMRAAVEKDADRVRARLAGRLSTYTARVETAADATWAATAARLVDAQLAELRARLAGVHTVEDQAAAHEARIAGKRLRYLLEPLRGQARGGEDHAAAAVDELKTLQDALGDLHDAHVFATEVAAAEAELEASPASGTDVPRAPDEPPRPRRRTPGPAVGLQALRGRLREREERELAALRGQWLGDDAAALASLVAHVERATAALRAAVTDDREIERKYLLRGVPREARHAPAAEIEQGYLPGARLIERLRRVRDADGERFYRTVKIGAGVERVELEEETSRRTFEALWRLTKGRRVRKRRYLVPDGDVTWEIDEFHDRRLVLAEVELPSADAAVTIPPWLHVCVEREVTDDGEFTNARLAR